MTDKRKHKLVLMSGGMDSAVAFAGVLESGAVASAVSFKYGQKHSRELESAKLLFAYYKKLRPEDIGEHYILDLTGAQDAFRGSALTGSGEVPEGHYEDKSMKKTVVPNRNMIFLSLASGVAVANNLSKVVYGAHAGDHAIYPDCRPEFLELVSKAVKTGNYNGPTIEAPFINKTKADIVKRGMKLEVPFQLTWSCYKGGTVHCGRCGTCVERLEAFELARHTDAVEYRYASKQSVAGS